MPRSPSPVSPWCRPDTHKRASVVLKKFLVFCLRCTTGVMTVNVLGFAILDDCRTHRIVDHGTDESARVAHRHRVRPTEQTATRHTQGRFCVRRVAGIERHQPRTAIRYRDYTSRSVRIKPVDTSQIVVAVHRPDGGRRPHWWCRRTSADARRSLSAGSSFQNATRKKTRN